MLRFSFDLILDSMACEYNSDAWTADVIVPTPRFSLSFVTKRAVFAELIALSLNCKDDIAVL